MSLMGSQLGKGQKRLTSFTLKSKDAGRISTAMSSAWRNWFRAPGFMSSPESWPFQKKWVHRYCSFFSLGVSATCDVVCHVVVLTMLFNALCLMRESLRLFARSLKLSKTKIILTTMALMLQTMTTLTTLTMLTVAMSTTNWSTEASEPPSKNRLTFSDESFVASHDHVEKHPRPQRRWRRRR